MLFFLGKQYTLSAKTIRVSEWLLFKVNWTIFQLYHGENRLHFYEIIMMLSALR